jgi:23S rRNA pseudouridine1911/1915/1917 synthase
VIVETIPPALAGERVDRIVALLTGATRREAADLVAAGSVRVDGEPAVAKARLRVGQVVEVDDEARPSAVPEADPAVEFTVVHADDAVIVVDKPVGLVVHPGAGNIDGTLVNGLLARYPELAEVGAPERPGIVHRLDAGTTGLLVVARTPAAYAALVAALAARRVDRRYRALVWGVPDGPSGIVDAPVGRSSREPTKMAVVVGGRPARTRYEVLEAFEAPARCALLECRLETGRTHQIRVHLAAIGHPVVGDARYGGARPAIELDRPFLHATHLGFRHPTTGEPVSFDSPLPADLRAVVTGLS